MKFVICGNVAKCNYFFKEGINNFKWEGLIDNATHYDHKEQAELIVSCYQKESKLKMRLRRITN